MSGLDFFDIIGWVYGKRKKRILKKTTIIVEVSGLDFFDIIGWVYEKTKKRILKKTAIIVEVSGLDFFDIIGWVYGKRKRVIYKKFNNVKKQSYNSYDCNCIRDCRVIFSKYINGKVGNIIYFRNLFFGYIFIKSYRYT